MFGTVRVNEDATESFPITCGVKQGCIIAPMLFIVYFDAVQQEALLGCNDGIQIRFRTDGLIFNLARLQAHTRTTSALAWELLDADDRGIFAHLESELKNLIDNFVRASKGFGLTVSIQETEVLYQPSPGTALNPPPQMAVDGTPLKVNQAFTYLESNLSNDENLDKEIDSRISKASSSFCRLGPRVWKSHDWKLSVKINAYRAVVVNMLLYAAETWNL